MDSILGRFDLPHRVHDEERLRRILDRLPTAAYACDAHGLITYFNPRAAELWGRAPRLLCDSDRFCGSLKLYTADGAPLSHDHCWMALAMRENRTIDGAVAVIERPDAERREVLAHCNPLHDAAGRVIGGVNVLVDVTTQRRIEQELRENDERYRALVERMQVLTWEGNIETLCFTYVSEYAEQLLGFPREAWYAPGFWVDHIHPDDRDAAVEYCTTTTMAGQDHRFDYRMVRADGQVVWIDEVVQVIQREGKVVGVRGLMIDITERMKLQEQMLHAQKMEAVGQLAGGVAHDFNNLLTVITGYSHLLLGQMASDDPNREALSAIYDAGEWAAALTRQLLTFSRRQTWHPVQVDLNSVVADSETLLRRLLGPNVQLNLCTGVGPTWARVDRGQIGQVVMNLAVNARDAMPQGGRLQITVDVCYSDDAHVELFPDLRPGRYARLAVSDTGDGMAEDVRAHIFEPFFTTKEVGKGTGLGLAVVHGIVKQSGGQIGVSSRVGAGTTFTILLPTIGN